MRIPGFILLIIIFAVNTLCPSCVKADAFVLPKPGSMVSLSPSIHPSLLKGIRVNPEDPLKFEFVLSPGDERYAEQEAVKLVRYFLAALTVPDKDIWVNLSPYEKDRIVPESFGQTQMGRDLLAQDYLLKQITASLVYPEGDIGKEFWKKVYEIAGNKNVPVNTFNKVWIVPDKAVVYENAKAGTAYVVESSLKVMTEQDYLATSKHEATGPAVASPVSSSFNPSPGGVADQNSTLPLALRSKQADAASPVAGVSQIVRSIVIPQLTKEVNEGKNFAQLRQVYNSLILATWYKKKIKDSILSQVYADKNKVDGITIDDPNEKERIYAQYLEAFKKGAYNFIKEERDQISGQMVPRKYFSGGAALMDVHLDYAMTVAANPTEALQKIAVVVEPQQKKPAVLRYQYYDMFKVSASEIQDIINEVSRWGYIKEANFLTVHGVLSAWEGNELVGVILVDGNGQLQALSRGTSVKPQQRGRKVALQMFLEISKRLRAEGRTTYQVNFETDRTRREFITSQALAKGIARVFNGGVSKLMDDKDKTVYKSTIILLNHFNENDTAARITADQLNEDRAMGSDYWDHSRFIKMLRLPNVAEYQGEDGRKYVIKFGTKKEVEKEIFAYEVARFLGVNVPDVDQLDTDMVRSLNAKSPTAEQYSPEAGFVLQPLEDINDNVLAGQNPSGLEEAAVFIHLMRHFDIEFHSSKNLYKRNVDNRIRYALYDFNRLEFDKIKYSPRDEGELARKWIAMIQEMDIDRFIAVLKRLDTDKDKFLGILNSHRLNLGVETAALMEQFYNNTKERMLSGLRSVKEGGYFLEGAIEAKRLVDMISALTGLIDQAQLSAFNKGGIDLNADRMGLDLKNAGEALKFKINPDLLQQLQNVSGFAPTIIDHQPMGDLKLFLGLN